MIAGQGIGLIVIGLSLRLVTSFVVVLGNGFSWLEMFFVSIAWIPKATVQVCAVRQSVGVLSVCTPVVTRARGTLQTCVNELFLQTFRVVVSLLDCNNLEYNSCYFRLPLDKLFWILPKREAEKMKSKLEDRYS